MVYVMSDIHGYYKSFLKMLEKIRFGEDDMLYIIGDLIDRGPSSLQLLEYCKNNPNIKVLKGNHEYMLEMYYNDNGVRKCWLRSGGDTTLGEIRNLYGENSKQEKDLVEWIGNLPLFEYIKVNGYYFLLTHAGMSKDLFEKYRKIYKISRWSKIDLEDLFEWAVEYLEWNRSSILWDKGIFESRFTFTKDYLIIGHTPNKSNKIEKINKVYNIDCGSYDKNGFLGCLCLDNFEEFYIKSVD